MFRSILFVLLFLIFVIFFIVYVKIIKRMRIKFKVYIIKFLSILLFSVLYLSGGSFCKVNNVFNLINKSVYIFIELYIFDIRRNV